MKYFSILFCLSGLLADVLFFQDKVDISSISKIMDEKEIPGLSYSWLEEGKLKESFAIGRANNKNQPVDQETVFSAASLSKPIFAYLVLQMVAEGILDLDMPLYTYFDYPDIAHDPRHKLVTSKMVLSHTSGLPNWRKGKLQFQYEPGERFRYSGEGFVWLQKVVEHLKGNNLEELAKEYVFEPLGMERSSFVFLEEFDANHSLSFKKNGKQMGKSKVKNPNAAASLQTTAYDYALFLEALLEGKKMSPGFQQLMFTPQVQVNLKEGKGQQVYWGMGVGIQETTEGRQIFQWGDNFTFRGFFTANIETGNAVVYFTNSQNGLSPVRELVKLGMPDPQPACDWLNYD
ncbi:serine hydrolase domain-containing protein [Cognataquiflexum rubidum]|uniref:serine hydrolase domain-containing protein n=1 Tax=Cognataquiflexum rubidum TaxID=2922273 RepID=UPI001F13B90E|nr:beta-lactamase family protein [Cognataquiflexum rubidum]MCH6232905.1 beta-lactamase family protein [Cognataquiflexum rubidum]